MEPIELSSEYTLEDNDFSSSQNLSKTSNFKGKSRNLSSFAV